MKILIMMDELIDVIAFDIGGTQGRCGFARVPRTSATGTGTVPPRKEFEFEALASFRRESSEQGPAWMERLIAGAKELTSARPRCAAISFGGPVSPDGRIQSVHVPGWENADLIGAVARAFDLERGLVFVENDANAGALGECRFGAGRGCRDMLYFTVSTGIGGGVILDGKLRRGAHGMAGEFGHIILDGDPGAPQYAAGKRGALEALASGPAIERVGRAELVRAGLGAPDNLSAKIVFEAAATGEAWAVETRRRCLSHLGRGIAAMVCAFDVERVVVGGGVSLAGDALFVPLRESVELFLPTFMRGKIQVLPAALGDRAPIVGAVASGLDKLNAMP